MHHFTRTYNNANVQTLINAPEYSAFGWNGQGKFKWSVMINNRRFDVKKKLMPQLLNMTQKHCAFCDFYPLTKDFFDPCIEHFKPKSQFPNLAFHWDNLYPVCNKCTQIKDNQFNDNLLRPDEEGYTFSQYFQISGEGKILPNPVLNNILKRRARETIRIYGLNSRTGLVLERKKWIEIYSDYPELGTDNQPFRFISAIYKNQVDTNDDEIINQFL